MRILHTTMTHCLSGAESTSSILSQFPMINRSKGVYTLRTREITQHNEKASEKEESIMNLTRALISIAGIAAISGLASADVYVSEIYSGLSGDDGTSDWFEVTWNGAGTFDTGTLYYEDDSMDPLNAGALDSFILNTGESAVFLIDSGAADIADFLNIWGAVSNVGLAAGGGGLGQGGDGVFLYDGNSAGANLVTSQSFNDGHNTSLATWEFDGLGGAQYSVVGVNGAYESASFFNDNYPGEQATLVGSPGAVPAPGVIALLGLGGIFASRRQR